MAFFMPQSENFKHIALWSCPRNVSTAFMYSWAQRKDTSIFDEPLYAYFLKQTGADRPDREASLTQMDSNAASVIKNVFQSPSATPITFTKNISNQILDLDWSFIENLFNIIFIRHPAEILNSYTKVIAQPTLLDIALKMQVELYEYLNNTNSKSIIIDHSTLLSNPRTCIQEICRFCEIDFDEAMLSWPAGPRIEDGPWAKFWYANVHRSTGFKSYIKWDNHEVKGTLESVYQEALVHYNYLSQKSLKL